MLKDAIRQTTAKAWIQAESRALLFFVLALPALVVLQVQGWVAPWHPMALGLIGLTWLASLFEYRQLAVYLRRTPVGLLLLLAGFAAVILGAWKTDPFIVLWWPVALFLVFVRLSSGQALAFGAAMLVLALAAVAARGDVPSHEWVRLAAVGGSLLWLYWLFFAYSRQNLQELAQQRAMLEVTKENLQQGLILIGRDGRIQLFNHRAAELLELPTDLLASHPAMNELVAFQTQRGDFGPGYSLVDAHAEPYLRAAQADQLEALRTGPVRYSRQTKNGRYLLIETTAMPGGDMVRTYTDVTDLELVNQQLQVVLQEYQQLRERERQQSYEQLVNALSRLSMYRDDETGQHIVRTQMYIRTLALALRVRGHYVDELSDAQIDRMVKAAPMHDLGKIGIPDHILKKPGRHTPEEAEVMRTHALIGETTLMTAAQGSTDQNALLAMGARIAGGHHENWDGSGYPRGLVGQAIPLEARLMSLADVYDALTTARIYKPAWTHEAAMAEIQRLRGVKFDPVLVDVWLLDHLQFRAIAQQFADEPLEAEA